MDNSTKKTETADILLEVEKKQSHAIQRDRVRFAPLLKSGEATTQGAAGKLKGCGYLSPAKCSKLLSR